MVLQLVGEGGLVEECKHLVVKKFATKCYKGLRLYRYRTVILFCMGVKLGLSHKGTQAESIREWPLKDEVTGE